MIGLLWLLACTSAPDVSPPQHDSGEATTDDTGAPPDTGSLDPFCAPDRARETWQTFGQGFLTGYCQGCHGSQVTERAGAPAEVVFNTEDDAWRWSERILARATGEMPDMPPAGGPPEELLWKLELWLRCETPPQTP